MIPLTSSDAMATGRSKPVFKRSASLGFANITSTETRRKGNRNDLRYQPYSVVTRRSLLQRSNSHQISRDDKVRVPDAERTKRAPVEKNRADLKQRHTQQRRSKTHNVNRISTELVKTEDTFYNRLIKENNLYDMACRLKESLTIGEYEKSAPWPKRGDLEPTVDTSLCQGEESTTGFHDYAESRGKTIVQTTENENAEESRCDYKNGDSYCDFFLPSFDDEICFPSLVCQDAQKADSKDISLGERGQASKHQKHHNTKHGFLDNETVTQVLRKADTVLLFDDKENESDNDFDFSVPIFPSQPSCEGDKAKLSWDQLLHDQCQIINYDCENDTDSLSNECDQLVDVRELLLSDDWLNNNPSLMTSRDVNYDDLSHMQGTYTCSVCTTNLEVDPFKSMQRNNTFSLSSFNGPSNPRSHDCDVMLYCPWCCSDRVVFHADRLRM